MCLRFAIPLVIAVLAGCQNSTTTESQHPVQREPFSTERHVAGELGPHDEGTAVVLELNQRDEERRKSAAGFGLTTRSFRAIRGDVDVVPISCARQKSAFEFVSGVTQDLYSRPPTDAELDAARSDDFSAVEFVRNAVDSPESATGVTRFISNLFKADEIALERNSIEEATLVADLRNEASQLVLRNREKKWPWFFTTRDVYCTEATADLYGLQVFGVAGFVPCKLPANRAGFLGLASVLRAFPSAFYDVNNNYHRVAFTIYLAKGIQLASSTNGPAGEGKVTPMPSCVSTLDVRRSQGGQMFGSAGVPGEGAACSLCHSPDHSGIAPAFALFDTGGEAMGLDDVDRIGFTESQGVNRDYLKSILKNDWSCWSPDKNSPPQRYKGQPGLGRVIAETANLGRALGVQIPQMLGNINPNANMVTYIERSYYRGGETLDAALEGYFLSDSYLCAEIGEVGND